MEEEIKHLLAISDPDSTITDVITDDETMVNYIFIEKNESLMYCSVCGARMHSRGVRTRKVNHPALQTGYKLTIVPKIRKWRCAVCGNYDHDHYNFVEDGKRNTKLTQFLVLDKMRSLEVTARHIARELHVSDTYVFETFVMMVDLPRLPLPDVISVDEVNMRFDKSNLYAVIIMDFRTSQIIDILPNRYKETYDEYFYHIPREERKNVKTIISDIYKPYLKFPDDYFPEAKSAVDSFHVVSLILNEVKKYINKVKKKYRVRDEKIRNEKNSKNNTEYKTIKKSREMILLDKYSWFMLKNHDDIKYAARWYKDRRGYEHYYDPVALERNYMELDPHFMAIRDLKEKYIKFNKKHINDPKGAEEELRTIIADYRNSEFTMFTEIAEKLEEHIPEIVYSFTYISGNSNSKNRDDVLRRISNGPIESLNRDPKTLRRLSRGVSNFEYTRNRILWATREDPHILGVPKDRKFIHKVTGKTRGSYKKKNDDDFER